MWAILVAMMSCQPGAVCYEHTNGWVVSTKTQALRNGTFYSSLRASNGKVFIQGKMINEIELWEKDNTPKIMVNAGIYF